MNIRNFALTICIAALAVCTAACAQFPGGHGPRDAMGGEQRGPRGEGMRGGGALDMPHSPGALVETQLDRLEDELKPGPAQRDAWNAYADKVQQLADEVTRTRSEARTSEPEESSATKQLDRIDVVMQHRAKLVADITALGRALYATLSSAQKAVADRELAMPVMLLAVGITPAGEAGATGRAGRERYR
jgi:hypothetical protein